MIAGSALYPPMAVNLTVHEVSPLMTPPTSVPDIQIVSDGNGEQFGIEQSENRPGMFRRMSSWFGSRR